MAKYLLYLILLILLSIGKVNIANSNEIEIIQFIIVLKKNLKILITI